MAGDLVLLTGSTGHVGFRVLRYALEQGYQVRAAVRSVAKGEALRSIPSLKALNKDDALSFVTVTDITADHAFDEAVKGVKYIIHVASPLVPSKPDIDFDKEVITPAVRGTMSILESANRVDTVKRVVITSSVAGIMSPEPAEGQRFSADDRLPSPEGPFTNGWTAYVASKITALNTAEAWVKKVQPSFDLIHIHPSFVEGRNDTTNSLEEFVSHGTNRMILNVALGIKSDPMFFSTNHVDDAAWVHVAALNPKIAGNQSFLTTNPGDDGPKWNDVREIVAKHFPEAVKAGILPNDGDTPSLLRLFAPEKTEKTFGFKFQSFESQVVSVISHYLELYRKEKGGN